MNHKSKLSRRERTYILRLQKVLLAFLGVEKNLICENDRKLVRDAATQAALQTIFIQPFNVDEEEEKFYEKISKN